MNSNEGFGNAILHFILKRELIFKHLFRFAIALTGILVINNSYGYMGVINNEWLAIALSILCAFIPLGFTGFILFCMLTIHLSVLSIGLCVVFVILWLFFWLLCKASGSKDTFQLIYMAVLYRIHMPFLLPGYEGLFRGKREVLPLIGGGVIAFYLRTIRLYEAAFRQSEDQVENLIIIKNNILANMNFYVFLIAISAMFLLIALIRRAPFPHCWMVAVFIGVVVEFVIMMTGYLFTNSSSQMNLLIISNIITLIIGLIISILPGEYKVKREKRLEFEDDDYQYYVLCVPKVRFEKSQKRVLRITRSKKELLAEEKKLSDEKET